MRKWHYCAVALVVAIVLVSGQGRSEYLFRKDGSIIHGKITGESAKNVTIRKADGKVERVERSDLMRILYTQLYMGKVYIRLTTGKVLDGYMVDEDQDTYTFRKDLYRPEEFTLQRSKVMFLVRSNPTDLEGKADRRYIALKWSPPFVAPKSYNIYARAATEKEFKVVGTSRSTSYRITGLRSNTPFKLYVTAIDREDKETLPSDEISITTLNAPPSAPAGIVLKSRKDGTAGKISADISWQASTDIDGTVAGYRIYRENERGFGRLADTKATSHTVPGLDPKANNRFLVRALDDRGDESEDSSIVTTRKSGIAVSAGAAFFAPIGDLADLADPGFGLAVRAGMNDFCDIANLNAFIETGAFRCGGANDRVDYFVMVPVAIGASYSLQVFSFMSVEPMLSFGYAWNAVSYRETILADAETKTGIDPVVTGGLDLNFSMGQRFFMRLGGRFGAIMEQDGAMYFSTVNLGAGYLFGM